MVPGPEKRIPGQSNADYERRSDPVGAHLAQNDVHRGLDLSWILVASRGIVRVVGRAFGRASR